VTALRVAFAGTPEFAVPSLESLLAAGHAVVGVLTQPDRPSGRGRHLTASPVKQAAIAHGLALSQPQRLASAAELSDLEGWRPDVLVVVAYGLILPAHVLELPRLGCVNVHASLLPRWRGAAPIQRAILAGDATTGVTIMQMDAGLDTGPILLEHSIPLAPGVTAGELTRELAGLGAAALVEALEALACGRARSRPQPAQGATYAAKIRKAEALIDWSQDAEQIARQIRAFNPSPVAETRWHGEPLKVLAAAALTDAAAGVSRAAGTVPGQVLGVRGEALGVWCGRGVLSVAEVQRPGRRPIGARDFVNAGVGAGAQLG